MNPLALVSVLELLLPGAPPAPDGYTPLGLASDGRVVLRHVDTARAIDRVEYCTQAEPAPVPLGADPGPLTPFVPGVVAPGSQAAVLIRVSVGEPFASVLIERLDGDGTTPVTAVPVACATAGSPFPALLIDVAWARAGADAAGRATEIAVVTGRVAGCGAQDATFVAITTSVTPLPAEERARIAGALLKESDGSVEPLASRLAEVAATLTPDDPRSLEVLARVRVREGAHGAAVSALWQLLRLQTPAATTALRAAVESDWAAPLADRPGFRALGWSTPPEPPVPTPPAEAAPGPP